MFDRAFRTVHAGCFGVIFGVFVTLGVGFVALRLGIGVGYADPIPEALARQRLADERDVAERLGFVLERELDIESTDDDVQATSLGAGECIAVIAAAWGTARVIAISIVPPAGARVTSHSDDALSMHASGVIVSHAQYCAPVARDVEIWTWIDEHARAAPAAVGGRIVILRGTLDPESLVRGWTLLPEHDLAADLPPDAGPPDAEPPDAGPPDAGPPDAGPPDARRRPRRAR